MRSIDTIFEGCSESSGYLALTRWRMEAILLG